MSVRKHAVARSDARTDVVGDRNNLIQVGMAAVGFTLLVFTVQRLVVALQTGLSTPWWGNAAGLVALTALWAWYRRGPQTRSSGAAHGTALIATITLLIPVAYGLTSTIWWLSLVGFAAVLLGRRQEAITWGVTIPLVMVASVIVEPYVQVQGAAGELPLELALAKIVFVVVLIGMAVGFRRVSEQRVLVLHDSEEKSEQALVKNQDLLIQAEKMGKVGGWEFDIETRQQTWTDMVYEIHELDITGRPTVDQGINFYTPASRPIIDGAVKRAIERGEPFDLELEIISAKGNLRSVHVIGKADLAGRKISGFFQDISERKRSEKLMSLQSEVLKVINTDIPVEQTAAKVVAVIKQEAGFDAVGLRLKTESDYPFVASLGYSEEFLKAENTLTSKDPNGGLCRNEDGTVSLECTCGMIVSGKADPANPLFTPGGSAWTNNSLPFLDVPPEADPRLHPRNRCIHVGFLSLALIPIRASGEILGMLHLADRRPDRFNLEAIRFFEGIGASVGGALERKQAEQDLFQSRRATLNMMTDAVEARDRVEQMSKVLRTSEVFNQALIANSPIGISVRSRTGDLLSSNAAWRNIWAISEEEYQGMLKEKSAELRFDERDVILLPYQEQVRQVYEQGGFLNLPDLKTRYFRPGNAEWVSQYYYGIMDDQGQVDRVVTLTEDISVRKQAEEDIRTLNAELEQRVIQRTAQLEATNKELEAFSYSVSHDLRAPLRGIDGWSLALLEDYGSQLDGQAKTYLERVRSETQRMGQLIDDLLQLSRLTSTDLSLRRVDLSAMAWTLAAGLQKAQPDRQVEFVIQPGLNANGDARLLEIALTNLLGNAFKFTGKTPQARIQFGQTEVEGQRAFFVRDNGAGFDMALAKKLFGAFQRMHKASDFPGTGVGLTTVQRIVHRHGGRIWAAAAVDQGATFYFTIEEKQ